MYSQWIVTKDADGDSYTFKNSDGNRFLGAPDAAAAGTVLKAQDDGDKFTIRKVPNTNYHK